MTRNNKPHVPPRDYKGNMDRDFALLRLKNQGLNSLLIQRMYRKDI
jgi:hypothetical protein